jgi:hypothetical protein
MRRTVTLDEDVIAGIKSEMERTGESFKQVVNRIIRIAYDVPQPSKEKSRGRHVACRKKES